MATNLTHPFRCPCEQCEGLGYSIYANQPRERDDLRTENQRLKDERAELVAALRLACEYSPDTERGAFNEARNQCRSLLAKLGESA